MWTVPLPGRMQAWARQGDALFVHVHPSGRGFLLELDWSTGTVRRAAYGLRTVYEMGAAADVVVLHGEDAVTAVAAREAGPSEASLHPAADEARRILAGRLDYWSSATRCARSRSWARTRCPSSASSYPRSIGSPSPSWPRWWRKPDTVRPRPSWPRASSRRRRTQLHTRRPVPSCWTRSRRSGDRTRCPRSPRCFGIRPCLRARRSRRSRHWPAWVLRTQ